MQNEFDQFVFPAANLMQGSFLLATDQFDFICIFSSFLIAKNYTRHIFPFPFSFFFPFSVLKTRVDRMEFWLT